MSDFQAHAQALADFQARQGDDCPYFLWGGKKCQAIPGTAQRRADLSPGGFQLNADLQFECLVAPMLTPAVSEVSALKSALLTTTIKYLEDAYKVDAVGIRMGGLVIRIECSSIDQNA
jgi:hypothetical protein